MKEETSRERKRRILFDRFSKNFQAVRPFASAFDNALPQGEFFICPICLGAFSREGLVQTYDDSLTMEDVPPKSVGGTVVTLTCKRCNNNAGGYLESELVKYLSVESFLQKRPGPGVKVRTNVRLKNADGNIETIRGHAMMNFDSNGVGNLDFPLKSGDPRLDRLTSGSSSLDAFEFKSPTIKTRSVDIALLRVAYLKAFCELGYGYILNSGLNAIRSQITNPNEQVLPRLGFLRETGLPDGLFVVLEPKKLQSLLVEFDLKVGQRVRRCSVILPSPIGDPSRLYDEFFSASGNSFRYCGIQTVSCVDDESMAMRAFDFWNKI